MFKRRDGRVVPSCDYCPNDMIDDNVESIDTVNCVRDSAES
jgi:hypothetical protein